MAPRTSEQFERIREDRKQKLIDAAFHVFAEETYHSASVSKIAREAGVSKGLLYNYFDTKEDLLRAIMSNLMEEIFQYFDFSDNAPLTDESVSDWIKKSLNIVKDDVKRWRFYTSLSMQPDVTPIFIEMATGEIQKFMESFVVYFSSKGVEDPVTYMRYCSAIVDGIQLHVMLDPENFPIEKVESILIKQITNPII
jgi:AcrR family transcriptional regulator